jgi:molecular chaperone GrpE
MYLDDEKQTETHSNDNIETLTPQPEITIEESVESILTKERDTFKDNWMRSIADMDNARKRFEKEKEDLGKYVISNFARDLLPLMDTFERALSMTTDVPESMKPFVDGIDLVHVELGKTLSKHNVEKINPFGELFNPHLHQAMSEIESNDHPSGHVTQVLQAGYAIQGRLLRPALVIISKGAKKEAS